ncbi:hypothetical protein [Ekhidna sp.]|uniref:hypothetical protein n=1 Tax=Ekhidna sp. TaxID=2608089 RepID=UPI003B5A100B
MFVDMAVHITKSEVHTTCRAYLEQKIEGLKEELEAVRESAIAETKSSMGDKYETGREMMMQERNRLGKQLDIYTDQLTTLESIDPDKSHDEVKHGCIVFTDKSTFFISSAIGQIDVNDQQIFAISNEAPIAKAMKGMRAGDIFNFNGTSQTIKKIE